MLTSELIAQLQEILAERGDLPVQVSSYDDGSGLNDSPSAFTVDDIRDFDFPDIIEDPNPYVIIC